MRTISLFLFGSRHDATNRVRGAAARWARRPDACFRSHRIGVDATAIDGKQIAEPNWQSGSYADSRTASICAPPIGNASEPSRWSAPDTPARCALRLRALRFTIAAMPVGDLNSRKI